MRYRFAIHIYDRTIDSVGAKHAPCDKHAHKRVRSLTRTRVTYSLDSRERAQRYSRGLICHVFAGEPRVANSARNTFHPWLTPRER